jgi:hypothetical protein
MYWLVGAIAAAVVMTAAPEDASAQKRIAVLEIEGARSGKLRNALVKLIQTEHKVISARTYKKAAKKLKANKLSPPHVSKVAARVEADGVLEGMIVAEDDRYVLKLRLHEGMSGKTVKKLALKLNSPKLSAKMKTKLADRLLAAIDDLPFLEAEDIEEEEPDDIEEDDEEGFIEADASEVAAMDDEDDEGFDDDMDGDDMERDDEMSIPRDKSQLARNGVVNIRAGLSVTGRTLSFTFREGFVEAPLGYEGPMAAGAYASGELYPMAMDAEKKKKGKVANLGIGFEFDRVMGLETAVDAGGGMVSNLITEQQHYAVGVRYRHNFGTTATSPTVVIGANYNQMKFAFDNPMELYIDMPQTTYTYYDPGAAVRWPLNDKMALHVAGSVMLVTDTGEIQAAEQYGRATVTGFDGEAGVEYLATEQITVRATGRYQAIGFSFEGDGDESNGRDGDVTTVDVGGALDKYMGATVTVGYLF